MQQAFGFMIETWPKVLGSDVAGEVHEVGSNVKAFKKGDRVAGITQGLLNGNPDEGAFALYTRLSTKNAAVIPSNVPFTDAAVLGMAIGTATSGLNGKDYLNQPFPGVDAKSTGRVLVVYGGSSAIGSMTTQLATAAGIRVISIASSKNFEFCRKCGASDVFDYNDSNVVDDVVKAVGKDTFAGIYNAISTEDTYKIALPILEKLGGGNMATSQPPPEKLPEKVNAAQMFGEGDHSAPVWQKFVTKALESGQLKCLPEPMVIGRGLQSLQEAMDRVKAGMSAKKVVIEL